MPISPIVKLARARFHQADDADRKQRQRELDDLRFEAGDQWDQWVKDARSGEGQVAQSGNQSPAPARPCYVVNKVSEPVRQILQQERQSDLGIEIIAADDFGGLPGGQTVDDTEIELREGLVRRIQRESEAKDARSWAFKRAVIAGRGYYLITTRFLPGLTWDQEIVVSRLYDQDAVRLDPTHEQPDGSDAMWGMIGELVPWEDYKAQYRQRGNRITTATASEFHDLVTNYPKWFTEDGTDDNKTRSVLVVHYYYVDETPLELALLEDGRVLKLTDVPEGVPVKETRTWAQRQVKWAKIDGANEDVLDETDVPSPWIPIVKVIGNELQPYDRERRVEGVVRPARDGQKGFNAFISKFVEDVALSSSGTVMLVEGQDEGFQDEWQQMYIRNLPVVHYKQTDVEGRPVANQPTTPPRNENITAIGAAITLFSEAIASTTGVVDPAQIQPQVRSDAGLRRIFEQVGRGTSSYLDNLARSIRHEGRIINSMLYTVYGRPGRLTKIVTGERNEMKPIVLHQPFMMQGPAEKQRPMLLQTGVPMQPGQPMPPGLLPQGAQYYTLTKDANFNVAVKVSKSYDTRREQEVETIGNILTADPSQLFIVGGPFFRNQDGPGHKELAERYEAMAPPPIQALINKGQMDPQLMAAQAKIQQLEQQLAGKTPELQAKLQIAQLQEQAETQRSTQSDAVALKKAEIAATATMSTAQAKVDAENFRSYVDAMETRLAHQLDLKLQLHSQHLDHIAASLDRLHAAKTLTQEHLHAHVLSAQEHQQALEQMQQQAALTPAPQPNGGDPNAPA